ncbi:DUF1972 domain-containing protein [Rhodococcus sp. NPDC003322]
MTVGSVAIIGSRGYPSFYGGFETLVRQLAPYLADHGWDVTVYGRPGATADLSADRHPAVRTRSTRGIESRSASTLSYGATSVLDAARVRPDVALILNVANGFWLPVLRARHIPSVVNVDGIEWERAKWGRVAKSMFRQGAALTARYGDILVCDSHEIADYWMAQFRRESVFLPYGGDSPNRDLEPVAGLHRHGYVLLVARFVPENTVNEFIDAAEALSSRHEIVIVGSSGYGGQLEERVRALDRANDRVHWMGHVCDDAKLFSLWQNAGTYFHGHSVGGTNPALVQAMACGAPTVALDTAFNREVLQGCAVFVEPNPRDIESAIDGVMTSRSQQRSLGSRAQQRARDCYSWESICAGYASTLRRAMRTQPARTRTPHPPWHVRVRAAIPFAHSSH